MRHSPSKTKHVIASRGQSPCEAIHCHSRIKACHSELWFGVYKNHRPWNKFRVTTMKKARHSELENTRSRFVSESAKWKRRCWTLFKRFYGLLRRFAPRNDERKKSSFHGRKLKIVPSRKNILNYRCANPFSAFETPYVRGGAREPVNHHRNPHAENSRQRRAEFCVHKC